jgi:hypothetical protein
MQVSGRPRLMVELLQCLEKGKTMPLVRIDVRKGKDLAYRQEIGRVVYEALVGVGAPKKVCSPSNECYEIRFI